MAMWYKILCDNNDDDVDDDEDDVADVDDDDDDNEDVDDDDLHDDDQFGAERFNWDDGASWLCLLKSPSVGFRSQFGSRHISKHELSIASETEIAWRCSHHALFLYACIIARTLHFSCMHASVLAPCMIQMCLHGSGLSHLKGANSLICTRWTNSSSNTSHWERNDYTHTHKSIKGSMGVRSNTIWERTHQTTFVDDMDTVLFVCFICLFVLFACLFSFFV